MDAILIEVGLTTVRSPITSGSPFSGSLVFMPGDDNAIPADLTLGCLSSDSVSLDHFTRVSTFSSTRAPFSAGDLSPGLITSATSRPLVCGSTTSRSVWTMSGRRHFQV